MKPHSRFLTVAILGAFGVGAALAQESQQQMPMMGNGAQGMMGRMGLDMMGPGNMGMMSPDWQGMMGPAMMGNFGPMMERRLAYLKAELAITDAQKAS